MSFFGSRYTPPPRNVAVMLGGAYIGPMESYSWRPIKLQIGGDGTPPVEAEVDWNRLSGDERIALGYLLSKSTGHKRPF